MKMPTAGAYAFAAANGLQTEAAAIADGTQLYPGFAMGRQVRKAHLLELFEEHNLLEAFFDVHWKAGAGDEGRATRERYKREREANDLLLDGKSPITDEQKEQINALLATGDLSPKKIAAKLSVSEGMVWLLKSGPNGDEEAEDAASKTFGLERDLQLALRASIEQLESGLEIIDGGKERQTPAGNLDITARDKSGTIVVIELKAGEAAPGALTQVLAYMGAVAQEEQKPVRGMLIAGSFHKKVTYAVQAVPNVQLRRYHFKFTFEPVE